MSGYVFPLSILYGLGLRNTLIEGDIAMEVAA